MEKQLKSERKGVIPYTSDEAAALVLDGNISKHLYLCLRNGAKIRNANIYPSYHKVLEAKKETYPRNINASELSCAVPLQDLLDHTAKRILLVLCKTRSDIVPQECKLLVKYGFDGSSGQSRYMQKWLSSADSEGDQSCSTRGPNDESIFLTSLVPLRLVSVATGEVLWKNPRTSSTRYCRPLRLRFVKEDVHELRNEEMFVKEQITDLKPLHTENCEVNYKLMLTMVDGKAVNALTGSSSGSCYLCGTKISKLNILSAVKPADSSKLQYGLSVLHAYIRFLECVLNISYRIGLKGEHEGVWKVTQQYKAKFNARKKLVQQALKDKLGLLVDIPKQGSGTTNNGNTARRFFLKPNEVHTATGFSKDLLVRFAVILHALSSGRNIKVDEFSLYGMKTAQMYVDTYMWYHMPPTVHKVLIHGAEIVNDCLLPMGELTEEAQEARNKDVRNFREFHTRKSSRQNNITDIFLRLLASSDPYLSSLRELKKSKLSSLSPEVSNDLKYLLHEDNADNTEQD